MRARSLGLMIGGVSLLGGSLAIVLSACGGNDSATHGFVYDGGNPDSGDDQPGDDDDDDDMDATTGDGAARDGSVGDGGKLDGAADAAKLDAAPGQDSAPPADAAPPQGLNCDGIVTAGEYGDATHQYLNTTSNQTWYMAWDQTNLYVAITTATASEAAVMYWDFGGSGATVGFGYDDVTPSQLPFQADTILYFKDGYHDYRLANGTGWAAAPSGVGDAAYKVCDTGASSTTRELVIPWADIASAFGGTQPPTFNFLGYLESPQGYLYGMAPGDNPGALDAGGVPWPHYFDVQVSGFNGDSPFDDEK